MKVRFAINALGPTSWIPALLILVTVAAPCATVVDVLSSDADPYKRSAAEVARRLTDGKHTVRNVLLDRLTPADLESADCVVAIGSPAAAALRQRQDLQVPLIYCMVTDSAAAGLLAPSICSGVEARVPLADQIGLIREALPNVRRIGLLHLDDDSGRALAAALKGAVPRHWDVKAVRATPNHLAEQIADITTDVDLVWTSVDGSLYTEATVRSLLLNAMRRQVPVFGFSPSFVRAGALFGIGIDPVTQGAQAAELAETALSRRAVGQAPESVLVRPRFQIAVNLIVAEKIGIELPTTLIERAEHVFRTGH